MSQDIWVLENELRKIIADYSLELQRLQTTINIDRKKYSDGRKGIETTGRINVSKSNGCYQYYFKEKDSCGKIKKHYVKSNERDWVRELLQKDYYDMQYRNSERIIKILRHLDSQISQNGIVACDASLLEGKRRLITRLSTTDEEFVDDWIKAGYIGKRFEEGSVEIYSEKGERVRSKSEKIIADKLFMLGIPYKYECPLQLKNSWVFYPDFTILDIKKRREIYWEHLGMMDNEQYVRKSLSKINIYEKNDIFLGRRLIITHETAMDPLDTRLLNSIINEYLINE